MKKRTFFIDRKRWARGGKKGEAELLNSKKNRCCLGFISEQCGVDEKELLNCPTPGWLSFKEQRKIEGLLVSKRHNHYYHVNEAIVVNDDTSIRDDEREKKLVFLFKKHNVRLVFKN